MTRAVPQYDHPHFCFGQCYIIVLTIMWLFPYCKCTIILDFISCRSIKLLNYYLLTNLFFYIFNVEKYPISSYISKVAMRLFLFLSHTQIYSIHLTHRLLIHVFVLFSYLFPITLKYATKEKCSNSNRTNYKVIMWIVVQWYITTGERAPNQIHKNKLIPIFLQGLISSMLLHHSFLEKLKQSNPIT